MIAERERLEAVIEFARLRCFTGQFEDTEALDLAIKLGLVEKYYEPGASAFLGLSKLRVRES